MIRRRFSKPVSALDVLAKDMKLGLALGRGASALTPVGDACLPLFAEGQALGFGHLDSAAVYKVYEAREKAQG